MLNHQQSRSPSARPWGTEPKGHPAGEQRAADKPQFVANPPGYGRRTPGRFTLIGAGVWFGIMLLAVMAYGYRYEIGKLGDRLAAILIPGHGY